MNSVLFFIFDEILLAIFFFDAGIILLIPSKKANLSNYRAIMTTSGLAVCIFQVGRERERQTDWKTVGASRPTNPEENRTRHADSFTQANTFSSLGISSANELLD